MSLADRILLWLLGWFEPERIGIVFIGLIVMFLSGLFLFRTRCPSCRRLFATQKTMGHFFSQRYELTCRYCGEKRTIMPRAPDRF